MEGPLINYKRDVCVSSRAVQNHNAITNILIFNLNRLEAVEKLHIINGQSRSRVIVWTYPAVQAAAIAGLTIDKAWQHPPP